MAYTDKYQGKLWANEEKTGNGPDFKGQLTDVADVAQVTTIGADGKKNIDWSKIPSEKKLSVSLWKNAEKDGTITLNVKVAQKTEELFPASNPASAETVPF